MTGERIPEKSRKEKINALADALEKMWSGGWGDSGIYTVSVEREKVRKLLHELLGEQ